MASKPTLTDGEVVKFLEGHINNAVGYNDSELAREREEVSKYLNMELPKRNSWASPRTPARTCSTACGPCTRKSWSVLWLPPDVVKFTGQGTEDVRQADIETEYCANVYFNQNQGYSINSAVVYDGLTAHIGVAKAWWNKIEQDEGLARPADPGGARASTPPWATT